MAWVIDYFPKISAVKSIVAKVPNVMNINESHTKVVPAIFHSLGISNAEKTDHDELQKSMVAEEI